jgi:hypothetical protein
MAREPPWRRCLSRTTFCTPRSRAARSLSREATPASATATRGARPKSSSCRTRDGTQRAWSGTRASPPSSSVMNYASASWIVTRVPNSVGFTALPLRIASVGGFDEAEPLVRVVGVAGQDPGPRLGEGPPDQASGLPELLRQALDLELREPHRADRVRRDVRHGAFGLPDHRPGVSHELPVERAHARLHQILARPPAQRHDREDSAGHAPRPIAPRHDTLGHRGAEPLQRPGQHADALRQGGTVGRIVDVRLDHGRVNAQPPSPHDAPLAGEHHPEHRISKFFAIGQRSGHPRHHRPRHSTRRSTAFNRPRTASRSSPLSSQPTGTQNRLSSSTS